MKSSRILLEFVELAIAPGALASRVEPLKWVGLWLQEERLGVLKCSLYYCQGQTPRLWGK